MVDLPGLDKVVLLAPKICINRCGAMVMGKNWLAHLENECPYRLALCPDGCGDRVLGKDLVAHKSVCPMKVLMDRAEVALRENALKEMRAAMAGLYSERERAAARLFSRGEETGSGGWANEKCAVAVTKLDTACSKLTDRCRRKAKDRLVSAIAQMGADQSDPTAESKEPPKNAMKFWDSFDAAVATRGSRPWDLNTTALQNLVEVLEEAAVCGADEKLRRRGEVMLIGGLNRLLEAAVEAKQEEVLQDALDRSQAALALIELEDIGDLPLAIHAAQVEAHRVALRDLPVSAPAAPDFIEAATNGDVDLCEWLLDHERANPSQADLRTGLTPLVIAAKAGDMPLCELLLERRAEVNGRSVSDGCSALHWACHLRYSRVASMLLQGKANPRLQDRRGQDALMKLVRRDFLGPAQGCAWRWEVQPGRLRGPRLPGSGYQDFEVAKVAAEANSACVGLCLRSEGLLPAESEDDELSPRKMLPDISLCGASQGAPTEDDAEAPFWTSYLKVACDATHDLRDLFAAGADAGSTDKENLTALHHHLLSSPSRGCMAAVLAMLAGGADVNAKDEKRGTTPFLLAVTARRADLVKAMVTQAWPPADVDARTSDGTSALALAESLGALEVAEILKGAGASAWQSVECYLGKRTSFVFDTRVPPVLD